jgi:GntR family transcriptional regulator
MNVKDNTPRQPLDFSRSNVARYIQLAALFVRRIESGQWAVGERIPTVEELAAECGVARMTIRQALDKLQEDGLIERFRAKGTFVKRQPQTELWCEVPTDWSGMLQSREEAVIEVLSVEEAVRPRGVLHKIGEEAPSYRHLRRRHWRHDSPFLLADIYIDERLCDLIPEDAFRTKTALKLVADIPGIEIVDVRQTLMINAADPETAELLQVPMNAPVAYVHRCAVDRAGCLVFIGNGIYRGDAVRLDLKLR